METYIVLVKDKYGMLDAYSGCEGKGTGLEMALSNYAYAKEHGYSEVRLLKYCEVATEVVYKIKE